MVDPLPFDLVRAPVDAPYELRPAGADRQEEWDRHVIVDVVHDGARVPPELTPYFDDDGAPLSEIADAFVRERDWGAGVVGERLAHHLGLRGYHLSQAARIVCDFNRFRGSSDPNAGHLGRRALFPPGSDLLSDEQKEHALRTCFDPVSEGLFSRASEAFSDCSVADARLLRITAHTYDDRVGEGHRRPKTSLIFTPYEYHESARLPANVYVSVFPDRLAEFTADRTLAYRMALLLERHYLPVAVNSPYFLPLGGAEIRFQVWCYMQYLQQMVEQIAPDALAQRLERLWPVITHVDEPWIEREIDPENLALLEELTVFREQHRSETVERYRYSAYRPNAIEVEVRKDVVWKGSWEILADGHEAFVPEPGGLQEDEIDRAASVMAAGIRKYLTEDQPGKHARALRKWG